MSNLGVKRQLVLLAILDEDVPRLVPFLGREDFGPSQQPQ